MMSSSKQPLIFSHPTLAKYLTLRDNTPETNLTEARVSIIMVIRFLQRIEIVIVPWVHGIGIEVDRSGERKCNWSP